MAGEQLDLNIEYFDQPMEREHYGRLLHLFYSLSPDGSSTDLRKDEIEALQRRRNDGTFESVARWQDCKSRFGAVVKASQENRLTSKMMESFYSSLDPEGRFKRLAEVQRGPLRVHISEPTRFVAEAVIPFGMYRVHCSNFQGDKATTCMEAAQDQAQYRLAASNSTPDIFCWPTATLSYGYFLMRNGVPEYAFSFQVQPYNHPLDCKPRSTLDDFQVQIGE